METRNSIALRESQRMILIQDGSELSKDAEAYLKENHIPYDILWQETKYSFEGASRLLEFLSELDDYDDEEEESYTECLLSPFSEEGFWVLLCKDLRNNIN